MDCINCGEKVNEGDLYCSKCSNSPSEESEAKEGAIKRRVNLKVIISITVLVAIAVIVVVFLFNRYNMDKNRGNTTGNINNYGLSVCKDGWVYYSEFRDGKSIIYKTNGSEKSQILYESQANIFFLNIVNDWIYYNKADLAKRDSKGYPVQSVICKMKTDGSEKSEIATVSLLDHLSIVDGWIYYSYIEGPKYIVDRIKADGSQKQEVLNTNKFISDFNVVNNWMYYLETDNSTHTTTICKEKSDGGDKKELLKEDKLDIDNLNVEGNSIYYKKADKETKAATIYSMKTDGSGEKEISKEDACAWSVINVADGWIYYMRDEKSSTYNCKVYKIKTDGSKKTEIFDKDTYISKINIVGNWIYYTKSDQNTGTEIRKMKLDGSDDSIA